MHINRIEDAILNLVFRDLRTLHLNMDEVSFIYSYL